MPVWFAIMREKTFEFLTLPSSHHTLRPTEFYSIRLRIQHSQKCLYSSHFHIKISPNFPNCFVYRERQCSSRNRIYCPCEIRINIFVSRVMTSDHNSVSWLENSISCYFNTRNSAFHITYKLQCEHWNLSCDETPEVEKKNNKSVAKMLQK